MEQYIDLFNGLATEESIFISIAMIICFLLGLLIALLLRAGKVRRLKRELKDAQKVQKDAEMQMKSIQLQLEERNKELQAASREKVDLLDRIEQIEGSKDGHYGEIYTLNQQIEELQGNNRGYAGAMEDLNDQLISLKAENDQLKKALDEQQSTVITPPVVSTDKTVIASEYDSLKERLNSFESTLNRLENENRLLRNDLSNIPTSTPQAAVQSTVIPAEPTPDLGMNKAVLYEKIIVDDRKHDDLTQIKNIGSFYAKKLNSIGVFTYSDIAAWDAARVEEVTNEIGYFSGAIEKEGWVSQAAALMNGTDTQERAIKAPSKKGKETNLKMIEGVGPKIEKVLKGGGINTWSDLASADPGRLKELLAEAGDRFKMHNPYTWPLQARLAAAGRWDELEQYQEELKGGREVG